MAPHLTALAVGPMQLVLQQLAPRIGLHDVLEPADLGRDHVGTSARRRSGGLAGLCVDRLLRLILRDGDQRHERYQGQQRCHAEDPGVCEPPRQAPEQRVERAARRLRAPGSAGDGVGSGGGHRR